MCSGLAGDYRVPVGFPPSGLTIDPKKGAWGLPFAFWREHIGDRGSQAAYAGGEVLSGSREHDEKRTRRRTLEDTLIKVSDSLERAKIAEYVNLLNRPGRLLWLNLAGGLARGVGFAVGFTLLGSMIIYVLTRSYIMNLPVIGNFLGELVWIIQQYLKGKG
jgi:hypothetical protein